MKIKSDKSFDVFISHNSKNKNVIRELRDLLEAREISCWLDECELRPGMPWQTALEKGIRSSFSVIVAIGKDGCGPWETEEMQAALSLATSEERAVIPVFLPGAPDKLSLPMFLENRTSVDLRAGLAKSGIEKLVWGIKGSSDSLEKSNHHIARNATAKAMKPGTFRIRTKLNCLSDLSDRLHFTNTAFLIRICQAFPTTDFRVIRDDDPTIYNPKSLANFVMGRFFHEDEVTVEVEGEMKILASQFFRTVWENLDGYSDDPKGARVRLDKLFTNVFETTYDPDLEDTDFTTNLFENFPRKKMSESRVVIAINDRLHDLTIPMIPLIVRNYKCSATLAFQLGDKGVFIFTITEENDYNLDVELIELDIPVGTQITIITKGQRRRLAATALGNVLSNLWQCDCWLRNQPKGSLDSLQTIDRLIELSSSLAKLPNEGYEYVLRPFISNSLPEKHIVINSSQTSFNKEQVITQMSELICSTNILNPNLVEEAITKVEKPISVVSSGRAILHGVVDWGPRISIAAAVYPSGVYWNAKEAPVRVVLMFVCVRDAHRTWRDYRKRISTLFHQFDSLRDQLVDSKTPQEFLQSLREVEESIAPTPSRPHAR